MTIWELDEARPERYPSRLTNESFRHRDKTSAHEHLPDAGAFCRRGKRPERWTEILISQKSSSITHRWPTAVGFLFPVIGLGKNKPSHMNPDEHTATNPSLDVRHPITVLSNLYLEIGLPLEAAVQSALADYESIFDENEAGLCAI